MPLPQQCHSHPTALQVQALHAESPPSTLYLSTLEAAPSPVESGVGQLCD
jgi:hypothetical protein